MLRNLFSGSMDPISVIVYVLSSLTVIFLTLPVHEFAHGWTAVKLGDNTPRWQGRLTLNPFAHIDYMGALCILLFGFGWAKPVQVNQRYFRNPKRDMAITALAGPLSNLIVALIALILYNGCYLLVLRGFPNAVFYVAYFFLYIANINVYLAVFNLIPVPPLDGSRILTAVLPYKYYYALMRYERYIFIGLFALIWLGVFDRPLAIASNAILDGIGALAKLPFRIFGL